MTETLGLLCMSYGTARGPDDVEAYYTHVRRGRPPPTELLEDLKRRYAAIGGRSYQVWFGKQAWNTISYSMVTGTTSVRDLDIGQFAADALRRGYIRRSWYLIDVEAGFELWQGGAGLATDSFAVNVPGSGSAPIAAGPAAARPAPSSAPAAASVSCTVTYSVVHTWPGGLQAQAVLTNTSSLLKGTNGKVWKLAAE